MTIKIEDYRGYEITFNTEDERFTWVMDNAKFEKQTYSACKSAIDEFIKENSKFEPFDAVFISNYLYGGDRRVKITSIRKDGRFMMEVKSKKEQLSEYHEKDYVVWEPAIDTILGKIAIYKSQIDEINKSIRQEMEKITSPTIAQIKKKYLPQ